MMDIKKIQEFLPHRYPFLLVDRVLDVKVGEEIIAIKNVTMNEWFFQGHFPGEPVMPGVLIVEALAQTGGLLLLHQLGDCKGKVMYFMSIDSAKFRKPVIPGDQLKMVVKIIKLKGTIAKIKGEAYVGEDIVCEAEMMAMVTNK